jgi:hypothetical protein
MFKNSIKLNFIFSFLFFNDKISYCVEISDVATTVIQEAQSTNNLFVIGVAFTSVAIGYAGYYLYKTYLKSLPPKPPSVDNGSFFDDPEIVRITLDENLSSSSSNSSSEIISTPSNFDILSLGVSQLTNVSNRMMENQRLYSQLLNTEYISRSMNDDLTDMTILLESIQSQNIEILRLLNDVNQLYVLYLSGV